MINIIWFLLIAISIIYSLLTGNISTINDEILLSGKSSLNLIINMLEITVLWMGILKIAQNSGLLSKFSKLISPILSKLFPSIPPSHESLDYISSNVAANMLGLGSAATPFGLKAMNCMQEENEDKNSASRSMITFMVMNTASVTLIPTTVISFRIINGSKNPTEIVGACIIITLLSCAFGLLVDRVFYHLWRKNK